MADRESEYRSAVDVFALLLSHRKPGHVLLMRREGNVPGAGFWALPSGRLEQGESVEQAVRRELREELGIVSQAGASTFSCVVHVQPPGMDARMGFAFAVRAWHGSPTIREPQLCSALGWFPITQLPQETFIYTREVIRLHLSGIPFSPLGWKTEPA